MNFKEEIKNGVVLVDFFATWCGPCKMLGPVLEQVESENKDVKFLKLNVDEEEELAREYGVMTIPTLILFKDGEIVKQNTGFVPKEFIQSWLDEVK